MPTNDSADPRRHRTGDALTPETPVSRLTAADSGFLGVRSPGLDSGGSRLGPQSRGGDAAGSVPLPGAWRRALERVQETASGNHALRQLTTRDLKRVSFGSNDTLGLSSHPSVCEAVADGARRRGAGATASPLAGGWTDEHQGLASEVAAWKGQQAALLFPCGFSMNVGVIPALVGAGDVVYCDRLSHASLIDGVRLSRAKFSRYRHRDLDHLESLLAQETELSPRARHLIVTDAIFSMDGTLAPLSELSALAERFDALLLIDDAHGTGILGDEGAGTASYCGVRVPLEVGTFSKALGLQGGYVCGDQQLIDHLRQQCRSFMYSTALAPPLVVATRVALELARNGDGRRQWLSRHIRTLCHALREAGHEVVGGEPTAICACIVGDSERAVRVSEELRQRGFEVPAIRPPTVPVGTSRLRLVPQATHTPEQIEGLITALIEVLALTAAAPPGNSRLSQPKPASNDPPSELSSISS